MKNLLSALLFVIALFTISGKASAQRTINSVGSTEDTKPLRFIEGIELQMDGTSTYTASTEKTDLTASKVKPTGVSLDDAQPLIECIGSWQIKYAQLLDREVEKLGNISLFRFIEEWWQTPYRYGGTGKSGIDCSAFAGLLLSSVYGFQLPRTARDQYNATEKVEPADMKEGDLVFFNTRGGISHVGVFLGDGYFVHSSTSQGVTISHLEDDYYKARFRGAGRPVSVVETEIASN